jgi:putative ABC transport system ATP-binding protein
MPGSPLDVIEMSEVSLTRGGKRVLHDVTAAFQRNEVSTIVGPSGSGKTSLLRCLNRLEAPEGGRVLLDGSDIVSMDPTALRRRVGMIFQVPLLFPGDVRSNLAYGLSELDEPKMVASLAAAGLDASFLDRDARALSVGQAQRACIARALVRDPEVLLMDEPTSSLDKDAAARIEALVGALVADGISIVLVTHDLAQAKRVGSHALLLVAGRIAAAGSPSEVEREWPEEVA